MEAVELVNGCCDAVLIFMLCSLFMPHISTDFDVHT